MLCLAPPLALSQTHPRRRASRLLSRIRIVAVPRPASVDAAVPVTVFVKIGLRDRYPLLSTVGALGVGRGGSARLGAPRCEIVYAAAARWLLRGRERLALCVASAGEGA